MTQPRLDPAVVEFADHPQEQRELFVHMFTLGVGKVGEGARTAQIRRILLHLLRQRAKLLRLKANAVQPGVQLELDRERPAELFGNSAEKPELPEAAQREP